MLQLLILVLGLRVDIMKGSSIYDHTTWKINEWMYAYTHKDRYVQNQLHVQGVLYMIT